MGDHDELERAYRLATAFLDGLDERHVGPATDATALRAALGGPLPETGEDAAASSTRSPPGSIPASRPAPARATSGSSSAARCRPRSPPTG